MHIGVALRAGKPAAFRKAQIRGKMRTASAGGQQGIWRSGPCIGGKHQQMLGSRF